MKRPRAGAAAEEASGVSDIGRAGRAVRSKLGERVNLPAPHPRRHAVRSRGWRGLFRRAAPAYPPSRAQPTHPRTRSMAEPLVSVILPTYNRLPLLKETVASIRAQTFGGWELLVVDDGSVDGTAEFLDALAREDPRV